MKTRVLAFGVLLLVPAIPFSAMAGTTRIDFETSVGPLNYRQQGTGELVASGGRASFTGPATVLLGDGGSPISSTGTNEVTLTLRPYSDAGDGVGVILIDASDPSNYATITIDSDGTVVLTSTWGETRTLTSGAPTATNILTVVDNRSEDRTTIILNQSHTAFLYGSIDGAMSIYIGVFSVSTASFELFEATGPGVPDYPPGDSDRDGVTDDDEAAAETDPNDPGNLPVYNTQGANITGLHGETVSIPAGSLPEDEVNIAVGMPPEPRPTGPVPGGRMVSGAARELDSDGHAFSAAVTVSIPYSHTDIVNIDESSLQAAWYDDPDFSLDGISNVSVNTTGNRVTFETTHFTYFVLVGLPADSDGDGVPNISDVFPYNPRGWTDSDGDGLGDEWEILWFSDLDTADDASDTDLDGTSDLREFEFGTDPLDPASCLPAAGGFALGLLGFGIGFRAARSLRSRPRAA